MALDNLLVRTRRSLQGENIEVVLDAVITEVFDNTVTVTENPVELGAQITDHSIIQPRTYTMEAVVSNTPLGFTGLQETAGNIIDSVTGFFGDSTGTGLTRAQAAYRDLVNIQSAREPITVQTGLNLLPNLLITRISSARTKDTSGALFFTADLREVIIVESETIERPDDITTGNIRMGASTPENQGRQLQQELPADSRSILAKGLDLFF